MVTRLSSQVLAVASLVACRQAVDPCPRGLRAPRDRDHCVRIDQVDGATEPVFVPDEEAAPDASGHDGPNDAEAAMDASDDGDITSGDAEDGDAAAAMDASTSWPSDASDGETTADSSDAHGSCQRAAVEAWRAGHLKSDMRERTTECRIDCDGDVTCMDLCLRRSAGIADCNACTRAEVECSARFCAYACLPSRTDRICLSCLCQADCVAAFDSCAGEPLGLCSPELFTFGTTATGPALDSPALFTGKSATGFLSITKFDATTELFASAAAWSSHFPAGSAQLVPVSFPDLDLALAYNTGCAAPPCTVRGYAVLRDGTFGAPLFEQRWDADYADIESFAHAGARYLVRVREHGPEAASGSNLLIDRLEWSVQRNLVESIPVLRTTLLSPSSQVYTTVEPFVLGDATLLFLLAPATGEAVIMRVQTDAEGLVLSSASDPIAWSRGWDVLESFKSFDHWYLLAFKSGRSPVEEEPARRARVWQPTLDARERIAVDELVYDADWTVDATHVLSFTDGAGRARVLLHEEAIGRLTIHLLDADPAQWPDNFSNIRQEQRRGFSPPWNVLALAKDGKW